LISQIFQEETVNLIDNELSCQFDIDSLLLDLSQLCMYVFAFD